MRFGKTMLAVAGATVLLAALVGTASAGRLSASAATVNAAFARISFRGGLGTAECEVIVNGTWHSRTISKVVLTLTGYVSAANVSRCARGGATVLRETLPWHIRYSSFTGTLPNITDITARVIGLAFRIVEPTFAVECLARGTPETPGIITFNRETATGAVAAAAVGGTLTCNPGGISGGLSGTSTNVAEAGGARITITLI